MPRHRSQGFDVTYSGGEGTTIKWRIDGGPEMLAKFALSEFVVTQDIIDAVAEHPDVRRVVIESISEGMEDQP